MAASTAWLYVATCAIGLYHHGEQANRVCVAVAVVLGFAAIYAMLRDWMACPRGREATIAMRLGIRIGKLRRW
ncbi:hypothetical protein ACFP2T_16625 [Plantactinospora solaniradicis]|uniref:Uncharacterized protein n=1 Tax=Plantactinospora solaniradicis TaxID=1723736 RepID=A0ABW1KBZ3_9ACTN